MKKSKSSDLAHNSDSDSDSWSDADSVNIDSSSSFDEDSDDDDSGSGYLTPDSGPRRPPAAPVPPEMPKSPQGQDPLDGLDEKAKTCLVVRNVCFYFWMGYCRNLFIYIICQKARLIPIVIVQIEEMLPWYTLKQIYLRSPVLDAGGKPEDPGKAREASIFLFFFYFQYLIQFWI